MTVELPATHVRILEQADRATGTAEEIVEQVLRQLHQLQQWNWVGIYLMRDGRLVLGPFVGKPTEHSEIEIGKGVCGSAVSEDRNIIVEDVRSRENYLACTLETRSEIVVLIRDDDGRVIGQFDIDSDAVGNFTAADEALLDRLAVIIRPHLLALTGSRC